MVNSDLIELFKSLTIKEIKRLSVFMDSPYTDRGRYRTEVQILFKMLQKHANTGGPELLNKEKIYQTVFPGKELVTGHLERVMFELSQLIRLFLLSERYFDDNNMSDQQLDYAGILQSRGLINKATQILNQALGDIEKIPIKSAIHYSKAFEAASMEYSMASQKNKWKDDLQIANTLKYLDLYYSASKLQLVNHYLLISSISKLTASEKNISINTSITFPEIGPEEEPTIFIAYKIYQLFTNEQPTKDGFEELLLLLRSYEAKMDEETTKLYFSYLRNYCTHLYMQGYLDLLPVLHQIQLDNLSKGYFLYQGKMPPGAYLSIATTALKVKKEEWAYNFIQQYKEQILDSKNAEEIYQLNMATYYFHIRDFNAALDILPPASEDLIRHLSCRRLEITIYYEIKSELLIYKLEAFKVYIHRASKKLISESTRERHANFVNLLLQLIQVQPGDQERVRRILSRIEEKEQVAEKEWLLEKAQMLVKK